MFYFCFLFYELQDDKDICRIHLFLIQKPRRKAIILFESQKKKKKWRTMRTKMFTKYVFRI